MEGKCTSMWTLFGWAFLSHHRDPPRVRPGARDREGEGLENGESGEVESPGERKQEKEAVETLC